MSVNNSSTPPTRLQRAVNAFFDASNTAPSAMVPVYFDRDGSVANRIQAVFNGTTVTWQPGQRRSNPIPTPPGVYLCVWRVSGSAGDTYRLRSGPQPQVTGGFKMKTLTGSGNQGCFEVVVL
jgi:hypothetical protein